VFGDLRFRLTPHAGEPGVGWTLTLCQRDTLDDFVAVVTPPYRGVNARDIHAWHFAERGPDGTPPNAPREQREFRFVRGAREHSAALSALQLALWPNGRPMSSVDSALAVVESLAVGHGTLTMRNVRRGAPDRDGVPVLASYDFDVVLTLPGAAR
jgi:hypothetical protein